jgi:ubiquinone/menaquinone biosynthesis C-methylase UbiE
MSFDRLARHYGWMERVLAGEKLQRCRTAFLNRVLWAREILVLGEGSGRFLCACRQAVARARVTCVDSSPRMLETARRRVERQGLGLKGIDFIRADVLTWSPSARVYDLVVTHFFLDCFRPEQLEGIVCGLSRACRGNAAWLVADFQIPERGPQRWRAEVIHGMMYAFFRAVTRLPARRLTAPDPFLAAHGFVLRERRVSEWGLLRSDLWQRGSATATQEQDHPGGRDG